MKQCTNCNEVKEFSYFPPHKGKPSGLSYWCNTCLNDYKKTWIKNNFNHVLDTRLKNKFGINLKQYDTMLNKQNGKCAICGENETITTNGIVRRLAVDHNRVCCANNKSCGLCVRGLLCNSCNTGIGKLKDDINLLNSAITYLQNNNSLKGEK